MTSNTDRPVRRRPRDRKSQILAAATDCFHRSGYHATGMNDIAAAVGITAGSLYWHYRNKQELLDQVVLTSLDLGLTALREVGDLDSALRALCAFTLDNRVISALWDKEAHNLSPEARDMARERQRAARDIVAAAVLDARPGLDRDTTALIAWAVLGLSASPSYHSVDVPRPTFETLLCDMAARVCLDARIPPVGPADDTRPPTGLPHTSRREAILSHAMRLFAERGYQVVGMEDIGAAAGISGPAVYNHFASKAELLATAVRRGAMALQFDLDQALLRSDTAEQALLRSTRVFCSASFALSGSAGLLLYAVPHLTPADQEAINRALADYTADWAGLLRDCRPDLGENEAHITVQAVFVMVGMLSRIPLLLKRPDSLETLVVLCLHALGLPSAADERDGRDG
ncbi:TetR/AcrR family transcriptional regulator [Streptomyces adustus]|uniref:TetR/AcrR family transcriptional regulator n=1 Tax=Streptomyces adustus TaxID=1609272 RepID=UPI00371C820E